MPAGFRANPAMVVHVSVPVAFLGAELTRDDAGVELRMDEIVRRFGLAREDPGRGSAHISTVEIRADAAAQALDVVGFAKAGVRA